MPALAILLFVGTCLNLNFACQSKQLELRCPKDTVIFITSAAYGRAGYLATHVCRGWNRQQNLNCRALNSFQIVSDRCKSRQSCIVPVSNSLFGDPCPGTRKFLEVKYRCLKRVVACEGERAHLKCPSKSRIEFFHANFGRLSSEICPGLNSNTTTSCRSGIRWLLTRQCSSNKCLLEATVDKFGDACPNVSKYLEIHYACRKIPIRQLVHCNGHSLYMQCHSGTQIKIDHAEFGRRSPHFCPGANSTTTTTCQASSALRRVTFICQGRPHCLLRISTEMFGDPCPGVAKYLLVRYFCG